jgi:hypothetical protein
MATSMSGWLNVLAGHAAANGAKHKACILLWMDGGPSHKDTFDLKPDSKGAGEFKPLPTVVPGIQISEHFPKVARIMNHGAIIRGMSTSEGAHGRAKYYLHTGYKEGVGGLVHPSLGSLVGKELARPDFPLPSFVSIGVRTYGSGFLGAHYQPLSVTDPAKGVENLRPHVDAGAFNDRIGLLGEMERAFHKDYKAASSSAHQTTYEKAVALMQCKEAKAFDLAQETDAARAAYGGSKFGEGCLLARRLIETGVSFVEVSSPGWDTHQNNFDRVKQLSGQVDPAMSALVLDLQSRGLLDSTLVVWMGEFGRTPNINARGDKPGRDHYPRAWSSVMFGGGIKGGQVIGRTDKQGAMVEERPVSTLDFMATVCRILGIDYTKQNIAPNGRPLRIVDKGANPINELTA